MPSIVHSIAAVRLELGDDHAYVVRAHRQVTQCFAVHVHDEGVTDVGHGIAGRGLQHAARVDGDVTVRIGEDAEDRVD